MALTVTHRTTSGSETDAMSAEAASFTPNANTLLVAAYVASRASATPTTPTLTGHGTWTAIDNHF
jgi:hypothetical protein